MVNKKKRTVQYVLMAVITILVVFPFVWMLLLSFKTNSEILSSPLSLPKSFNLDNYKHAMETLNFPKLYANTIFVCVISLAAELVITFFSSFVLARMEFKNEKIRKMLYGFLIMGLSISPFILLFPVYKINVFFGLRGKLALIFPYIATSISFNTLLLVGYLKSLPTEIDEAAVIDGAGRLKQMWHVTLPGIIPTVVLVGTLSLSNVLNAGFDQIYNLLSPTVYKSGDIIDTFVYRMGMIEQQYSISTAVSTFKSLVSFGLISLSYFLADRFAGYRIF